MKNISTTLLLATSILFMLASLFLGWTAWEMDRDPIHKIGREYYHFRLYEDGSWEGVTKNGVEYQGCLPRGLCQD